MMSNVRSKCRLANERAWLVVFIIVAFILGGLRLFIWPGHPLSFWGTMETIAHIYIGLGVGAMVFHRPEYITGECDTRFRKRVFWILLVPSLIELVMAILYLKGVYTR